MSKIVYNNYYKRIFFFYILLVFSGLLIFILEISRGLASFGIISTNNTLFFLDVSIILVSLLLIRKFSFNNILIRYLSVFTIVVIFQNTFFFLFDLQDIGITIKLFFQQIAAILLFIVTYSFISSNIRFSKIFLNLLIIYIVISFIIISYTQLILRPNISGFGSFSFAYYIIVFFPLLFLIKQRILRYLLLFIVLFLSIISLKRGGVFAIGIGFFIASFFNILYKKEKVFRGIAQLISIAAVFVFLLIRFNGAYKEVEFKDDLLSVGSTEGWNGREDIYPQIIDGILYSDFNSLIFGHGLFSTINVTGLSKAHNDFLEIFFDFGLVGALLYGLLYFGLFKLMYRFKVQKSPLFFSFVMSVVMFFVLSMLSFVFFVQLYNMFLFIWAFILGSEKYRNKRMIIIRNNQISINKSREIV